MCFLNNWILAKLNKKNLNLTIILILLERNKSRRDEWAKIKNIKRWASLEIETFVLCWYFWTVFFIFNIVFFLFIRWPLFNSRSFLLFTFWLILMDFLWLQIGADLLVLILKVSHRFITPSIILRGIEIWKVGKDVGRVEGDVRDHRRLLVEYGFLSFSFLFTLMCECAARAELALA